MRTAIRQPITRPVWQILLSWGLAVMMIAGLLSFWIWKNEQDQERDERALQLQQDRAVCGIIRLFLSAPEPEAGPNGDRARAIRQGMTDWKDALHCTELESANPGPARNRDHR